MPKHLIVIAGPTAIGKTAAAISLARHFDTAILSADSRQFYREMSIGTAKPSSQELAEAKHYFINSCCITENFNVGDFETQGLAVLNEVFQTKDIALMAGGSGLYIRAVCEGFDQVPQADAGIRKSLNDLFTEKGIKSLQERLKEVDPNYYNDVDLNNPQRIIRALEVFETTGQPYSQYRKGTYQERPFKSVMIGLDRPRAELYERINKRVDIMMEQGLLAEVESLLPYRHLNALHTVGYTELFEYLDGKTDLDTAVAMIKQNTRRFAKRQLTWFRKDAGIRWFHPTDLAGMTDYINDFYKA